MSSMSMMQQKYNRKEEYILLKANQGFQIMNTHKSNGITKHVKIIIILSRI